MAHSKDRIHAYGGSGESEEGDTLAQSHGQPPPLVSHGEATPRWVDRPSRHVCRVTITDAGFALWRRATGLLLPPSSPAQSGLLVAGGDHLSNRPFRNAQVHRLSTHVA